MALWSREWEAQSHSGAMSGVLIEEENSGVSKCPFQFFECLHVALGIALGGFNSLQGRQPNLGAFGQSRLTPTKQGTGGADL